MRTHGSDDERATRAFYRETVIWKRLEHPNILPLLGVTTSPLQLISDWMSGGDLQEYIKKHPDTDRLKLLCDVTKGLCYLHSRNMIHGDLKGPNILVDDFGRARIADFAVTMVTKDEDFLEDDSAGGYTPGWAAPETIEEGAKSKESDIFSFAMVMVEVFSGTIPYSDGSPYRTLFAIMKGERPPRPTHPTFTENLWTLMQRCWSHDPRLRPEASEILDVLLTPASVSHLF
ncbi:kinase-like protein [Thelephora ganbajun]|uniref:Kinase-like protein n=1 Tax=Thelephora ganbajun TaxID=370292 RepID=A0ACB6Z0E0_THEGA|nr:kinase-like protein [Thelephora ganbajun]